jgi:hypothetical protein
MGRIRTVKPEFFYDEELSSLSAETHLLAAGLLTYADDFGYFNANPGLVRAGTLTLRELSGEIPEMLASLSRIGYLRLGSAPDGKRYGHIVKFTTHQRVSHPTPSKIEPLPITWESDSGSLPNFSGELRNDSALNREQGTGNREQGTGKTSDVETSGDQSQLELIEGTTLQADNRDKAQEAEEPLSLPDWVPEKTWNDYVKMRKKIRKPMTDGAMKLAVGTLERLRADGDDPRLVLEQSILSSWPGVYELKGKAASKKPGSSRPSDSWMNSTATTAPPKDPDAQMAENTRNKIAAGNQVTRMELKHLDDYGKGQAAKRNLAAQAAALSMNSMSGKLQ